MPLFDFKCIECGSVQEFLVLASGKKKPVCEDCGAKTEKLVGRPGGFILKGPGFYQNDYKTGPDADESRRALDSIAEKNPNMPILEE